MSPDVSGDEVTMKVRITAILLAVVLSGGAAAADSVAAPATMQTAESTAATTGVAPRRPHRRHRHAARTIERVYDGPAYLGRPVYYAPAPFPPGFGFGFFW
jgi:hypothetical protein